MLSVITSKVFTPEETQEYLLGLSLCRSNERCSEHIEVSRVEFEDLELELG